MLENIYKDIRNRLKTMVPELQLIDLDTGQLELQTDSYPILCPAVFIDFQGSSAWINTTQQLYIGDVNINIRIVFDIIEDMSNLTPDAISDEAISKLQVQTKIHIALAGFAGSNYNSLTLLSGPSSERREDGYKVYEYTYVTNVRNSVAMPVLTAINDVEPTVTKKTAP